MIFADAFSHVLDTRVWHIFESLHYEITLPWFLTKYSVLMIVAAILLLAIYIPLGKRIQTGEAPRGLFWNFFEGLLVFVRDEIAKPYIPVDPDRYVPYLWTTFLFILFSNLLGMFPFLGSPTASFAVTSVLAVGSLLFIHISSIMRYGLQTHLMAFAPHLDMPPAMKYGILAMLWPIEFFGLILKCFVLSVRLFANMFAGHMVLATILLFITMVRGQGLLLESTVTIASVAGVTALSLLELFVAFLQAYVFTFLTALFFGGVLEHADHVAHAAHDHGDHGHGHGHDHHGHDHHGHAKHEDHLAGHA